MKKIVYILLISFFSVKGFSQTTPVPGTTPLITPQNSRAAFKLNLQIPYGQDTSLNGGLDSVGSLFFQLRDSSLYVRIPGKWVAMTTKGGGAIGGDSVWVGTTSQLRTINDAKIKSGFTTNNGVGTWIVDPSDVTSVDNDANLIIDELGRRWYRNYNGLDDFDWYKKVGVTDSAALSRAIAYCRTGISIGARNLLLRWVRLSRDNITIEGIPGQTILRLQVSEEDGNTIFLFKDSADHNITGVKIYGLTMIGNTAEQTGINNSIMAIGGPYGGPATDTATNVLVENCVFKDAPTTGAVRFISDTLRNNNWVFRNNTFDSSQGYHVTLWGSLNMTWDNNIIKNWANADTSAYPGFNMSTNLNKNLTLRNNQFYNNRGGRFAIEYAGALVNAVFDHNYYNGNGRGGAGTSGGPCVNCQFINEIKENGDGTHRAGYEIVGGGNTFFNDRIENGAMLFACLADAVAMPSGYDSLRNNGLNISKVIVKNSLGGALGLGGQNVNTTGLKNVTLTNSQFETGSSKAAIEISAVRNLVIDNINSNAKHYNIRFVNSKWSATDSLSSDIIIRNNTLKASANIIAFGWPNIYINSPQPLTASKIRNVTIENNNYSNNLIFYEDTLISTWTSNGNIPIGDTASFSFRFDRNALLGRGVGIPENKVTADIGSIYIDLSTQKRYTKTTTNSKTGWVEWPPPFDAARKPQYVLIGKGSNFDTTYALLVDTTTGYVRIGSKDWSPSVSLLVAQDSTVSPTASIYLVNPKKSDTRITRFVARDGNNEGVLMGWNGSYASLETMGNYPMRFYTNGLQRGVFSAGGNFGIRNSTPGYMLSMGSPGDPAIMDLYGLTSGHVLVQAPDNSTPFTTKLPGTIGNVGDVLGIASKSGTVIETQWQAPTGGGGGSGASLMGTSY